MAIELKNEQDKFSYALGMNISASVLQLPLDVNKEVIIQCVTDLLNGAQPQLEEKEYHQIMQDFQKKLQEIANEQKKKVADENAKVSADFLTENAKKDGIKVTESGLQYEVITEGNGKKPSATDRVKCHYEGTLIDGTLFDSSIKRGQPAVFGVNQVIKGWVEALQLMSEGSKWRLFIPSELGYGAQQAGEMIPPHSTLIFEVELIEVL